MKSICCLFLVIICSLEAYSFTGQYLQGGDVFLNQEFYLCPIKKLGESRVLPSYSEFYHPLYKQMKIKEVETDYSNKIIKYSKFDKNGYLMSIKVISKADNKREVIYYIKYYYSSHHRNIEIKDEGQNTTEIPEYLSNLYNIKNNECINLVYNDNLKLDSATCHYKIGDTSKMKIIKCTYNEQRNIVLSTDSEIAAVNNVIVSHKEQVLEKYSYIVKCVLPYKSYIHNSIQFLTSEVNVVGDLDNIINNIDSISVMIVENDNKAYLYIKSDSSTLYFSSIIFNHEYSYKIFEYINIEQLTFYNYWNTRICLIRNFSKPQPKKGYFGNENFKMTKYDYYDADKKIVYFDTGDYDLLYMKTKYSFQNNTNLIKYISIYSDYTKENFTINYKYHYGTNLFW